MRDGRKGRLQEAGEILQWRTEKGWTAGGWAVKSMRREERADCKKLGRPFSTGGEKRGRTARSWGDPSVQEERREGGLQEAVETLQYRRREERVDCRMLGRPFGK